MHKAKTLRLTALIISFSLPFMLTSPVLAATGDVGSVENFIRNIIQVIAGLAGLIATGFFVVGGFGYITSSGNPEHLDRSKKTLLYSATGLAIIISAFVLSNIVTDIATKAFGR